MSHSEDRHLDFVLKHYQPGRFDTQKAIGRFKDANGILEKWHKAGVTSSGALSSLDKEQETKASQAKKKSSKASSNSFNSYEQRPYSNDDFRALEQLLNK